MGPSPFSSFFSTDLSFFAPNRRGCYRDRYYVGLWAVILVICEELLAFSLVIGYDTPRL
ncbi:hypothetical protein BDV25DRAFT_157233 [Aspergillus avenaceus]|uniref:Uncharacterized protein n=1 Tax=Aspergillus avenaceus TaxID=36643 RepID=A0A5N6TS36_ASPAV|nr:hypothetical protein BDV25DRAFT_157233 [Aspergillus avenaceus]